MPLLGALLAGVGDPLRMSQDFATTQAAIYRVEIDALPEYRNVLRQLLLDAPQDWFSARQKQKLADHIRQLPPGSHLCHMDYHAGAGGAAPVYTGSSGQRHARTSGGRLHGDRQLY